MDFFESVLSDFLFPQWCSDWTARVVSWLDSESGVLVGQRRWCSDWTARVVFWMDNESGVLTGQQEWCSGWTTRVVFCNPVVDTTDAEIKVASCGNLPLQLHISPAAGNFTFLMSTFTVHSISLFLCPLLSLI